MLLFAPYLASLADDSKFDLQRNFIETICLFFTYYVYPVFDEFEATYSIDVSSESLNEEEAKWVLNIQDKSLSDLLAVFNDEIV